MFNHTFYFHDWYKKKINTSNKIKKPHRFRNGNDNKEDENKDKNDESKQESKSGDEKTNELKKAPDGDDNGDDAFPLQFISVLIQINTAMQNYLKIAVVVKCVQLLKIRI